MQFGDVLLVCQHFGDSLTATWSNVVLRKHEFSQSTLARDAFANGNAAVTHDLVVGQVQHQQISLVFQTLGELLGSIFKYEAVTQMKVCLAPFTPITFTLRSSFVKNFLF